MSMGLTMPAAYAEFNNPGTPGAWDSLDMLTGLPFPAFVPANPSGIFDYIQYAPKFTRSGLCYWYYKAKEITVTTPIGTSIIDMRNLFASGPAPFFPSTPAINNFEIDAQSFFFPLYYRPVTQVSDPFVFRLTWFYGGFGISGAFQPLYADGTGGYFPLLEFNDLGFISAPSDGSAPSVGTLRLQDLAGNDLATCDIGYSGGGSPPTFGDVTAQVTTEWP